MMNSWFLLRLESHRHHNGCPWQRLKFHCCSSTFTGVASWINISTYSSLIWALELSWHSLWDFFSLLRSYSTKYITSFYFLSLSLYLVLIARSIPKLLCFEFMYLFNNGNGVLYVCVRVARSIPKQSCLHLQSPPS